jgi:hypothetical protein
MARTTFTTAAVNLSASNTEAGIMSQTTIPFNNHLGIKAGMNAISHTNLVPSKINNIKVNLPKPLNVTETAIHQCLVYTKTVRVMATNGRAIPYQTKLTHIRVIMGNTHILNLAIREIKSNLDKQLWYPSMDNRPLP